MNITTILLTVAIIAGALFLIKKCGGGCCGTKKDADKTGGHEHKEGGCGCGHKH